MFIHHHSSSSFLIIIIIHHHCHRTEVGKEVIILKHMF